MRRWRKLIFLSVVIGLAVPAYATNESAPVKIFHYIKQSWPTEPSLVVFPPSTSLQHRFPAASREGYVYSAGGWTGLGVMDCRDVLHPKPLHRLEVPGGALSIKLEGAIGLVFSFGNWVHILDFSEPAFPRILSSINTAAPVVDAIISDTRLYVSQAAVTSDDPPLYGGLGCYDIGNPEAPKLLGLTAVSYPGRLAASGNNVWVRSAAQPLSLYDTTNPSKSVRKYYDPTTKSSDQPSEMVAYRGVLFVDSQVRDVNTGTLIKANYRTSGVGIGPNITTAWFHEGRLHLVCDSGEEAYEVSDPRAPVYLGTSPNLAASAADLGMLPFAADSGILYGWSPSMPAIGLFDFRNQDSPVFLSRTFNPGSDLQILQLLDRGSYLYAAGPYGLVTFSKTNGNSFSVVSEVPFTEPSFASPYEAVASRDFLLLPGPKPKLFSLASPGNPVLLTDNFMTNQTVSFKQIDGSKVSAFTFQPVKAQLVSVDLADPLHPAVKYSPYDSPYFFWYSVQMSGRTVVGTSGTYLELMDWEFNKIPKPVAVFGSLYRPEGAIFTTNTWCATLSSAGRELNLHSFTNLQTPQILALPWGNSALPARTLLIGLTNRTWVSVIRGPWSETASAFTLDSAFSVSAPFIAGQPDRPEAVIASAERVVLASDYLGVPYLYTGKADYLLTVGLALQLDLRQQTIDFKPLPDRSFLSAPFALEAVSSSGLPVSFKVVAGPATITNNLLSITNSGIIKVQATQPGDANYYPASSVEQSFVATRPLFTVSISATNGSVEITPNRTRVAWGDSLSLNAIPATNYVFSSWLGNVVSTNNPLTVTVTNDLSLTALFSTSFLFTDSTSGGKVQRVPDLPRYVPGDTVLLTALPDRWYEFVSWDDGSTANPRMVVVGDTLRVHAVFHETVPLETLDVGGTLLRGPVGTPWVLLDGRAQTNTSASVLGEVEVDFRSSFTNATILYTLDGTPPNAFSRVFSTPFTLKNSATLRAMALTHDLKETVEADAISILVQPGFTIETLNSLGGRVSKTPSSKFYTPGASVALEALPDAGWRFQQWQGSIASTQSMLLITLDHNLILRALFETQLSLLTQPSGQIYQEPPEPWLVYGQEVCLTAVPPKGYGLAYWSDPSAGRNNPFCFQVTDPMPSLTATFAPLTDGYVSVTTVARGLGHITRRPPSEIVKRGTPVTLVAVPDPGQVFRGWTSPEVVQLATQEFVASDDQVWIAEFTRAPHMGGVILENRTAEPRVWISLNAEPGSSCSIMSATNLEGPWQERQTIRTVFREQSIWLPLTQDQHSEYFRVLVGDASER